MEVLAMRRPLLALSFAVPLLVLACGDNGGGSTTKPAETSTGQPTTSGTSEPDTTTSSSTGTTEVDPTATSGGEMCGNGTQEGFEGCDDGNMVNEDDCTNECKLPICGDSILYNMGNG